MTDDDVTRPLASSDPTIEQIIEACKPMGNLNDLLIEDLTQEEEERFFGVLEDI